MYCIDPDLPFNWIEVNSLVSGIGSLATFGAFIYLLLESKSTKRQQFESTYFHLLNLHNEIISNLPEGRKFFQHIVAEFSPLNHKMVSEDRQNEDGDWIAGESRELNSIEEAQEILNTSFVTLYSSHEAHLNHYFRNLYYIMKFIDEASQVTNKQRKFYAGLLRAQLSENELIISMFNVMLDNYGFPKATFLMQKYSMWENMTAREVNKFFLVLLSQRIEDAKNINKETAESVMRQPRNVK